MSQSSDFGFVVCPANLVRALSLQSTAASGGASAKGPARVIKPKPSKKRPRSSDERGDSTGHGDAEEAEERGPADVAAAAQSQPASGTGSGEVEDATVTRMAAFGLHHVNDPQMRKLLREFVPWWASVKQHGAQRFLWRMLHLAEMDEQAVLRLNFSGEIRRVHCLVCAHAICSCALAP